MNHPSLGQHFLYDPKIINAIVRASELSPEDTILEIGTGTGSLTRALAKTKCRIISVEKDSRLVEQSKDWRRDYPNLAVIRADILKLNVKPYAAKPWVIVGNLPYYLTGKLLRTMVEQWPKPKRLVFMLQKEVAQRLTNPKRFSKISVFAQLYGKLEIIKHVAPGAFSPPPKVWSSIIKIEPHKTAFPELNQPPFKTLITKAFSSPRKYLINNLKDLYPEPDINHGLKELEISARARAETILPQQWIRFYKLLSKQPH